mgnify:CR=1 FL=1
MEYNNQTFRNLINKATKIAEESIELEALANSLPTPAQADVSAVSQVETGDGEAYNGISSSANLPDIGDTSSANQSAVLKQSFLALQEDVVAMQATLNGLLAKLRTAGILSA